MPSQRLARVAGLFYALNIVLGSLALLWTRAGSPAAAEQMTVAAAADYAIVVLLLGCLFEPAGRGFSWTIAAVGLVGCAVSALEPLHLMASPVNALGVFGIYCLGLGALVLRSALMPRIIGLLLMAGGLSWLTFALPSLSHRLAPWNTAPGAIAELIFTLWLLAFGVRSLNQPPSAQPA
jgi:Domain of unknown function (DUF4386)